MGKQRISISTERAIIKLYESGVTYNDIQDKLSVGKNTILRCLKRNGIDLQGVGIIRIDTDVKNSVLKMFNSGSQLKDIQDAHNLSYHMVKKILVEADIQLPGSGSKYIEPTLISKVLDLYSNKVSLLSISELLGISYSKTNKIVQRYGNREKGVIRERHGNWKGGRIIIGRYVCLRLSKNDIYFEMCNSSGYVMEHRYVMANHLGRPLTKQETVHHIDGNTLNNEINNLQLRQTRHGKGQKFMCCDCGSNNIKAEEL